MKVKVTKEFELHSNHIAREDDVFDLVSTQVDSKGHLIVVLEKWCHVFVVRFNDEFSANDHLEFDYEEKECCSAEVYISESKHKHQIEEAIAEKQKEVDYWKDKCIKLIDKI